MKAITKSDEIIYEYYLKANYETRKHLGDAEKHEALLETMHFFYRGITGDTDFAKTLEQSSQAKLLQSSTKSNLVRSIEAVEHVLSVAGELMTDEELEEEDQARIQNALNGDEAKDQLDKRQKAIGDVESMFGYSNVPGTGSPESLKEFTKRKNMISKIMSSKRVRQILDMYGQFLAHMNQVKRQRRFPDASNIVDVELGDDITNMVFDEHIMFAAPELEFLANYKLATKELLQYKNEAEKDTSKGDFQILIDTSYSTSAPFDNQEDTTILDTEIAFALAVIKFAKDDGRVAKVWTFNNHTHCIGDTSGSLAEIFDSLLSLMSDGSTCAQSALSTVLHHSGDSDGDVMMITDGEFQLTHLNKRNKRIIAALVLSYAVNSYAKSAYFSGQIDAFFPVQKMDDFKELALTLI